MTRRLVEALATLAVGFGIGILYAWVVSPIKYIDTAPSTLRSDFKDQYRTVIAAAYSATHNLDRARARLVLLGDPNPVQALTAQAQRMLAAGLPFVDAQEVAQLATDLTSGVSSAGRSSTASPVGEVPSSATATLESAGPASPSTLTPPALETQPTPEVIDTATPRPTPTAIPTPLAPFQLVSQDQVCNPNLTDGLLQVSIVDRNGHSMPGVEITITWDNGEENFFTGLKPDISNGYADYVMQPGISYSVRIASTGTPFSGLTPPSCPVTGGQAFTGGLKLTFQQP